MSTEFVTAPKSGVLVSLASHYLFKGYRVCFTLDAIKQHSPAGAALIEATDREVLRREVQRTSRWKHRVSAESQAVAQALEDRVNEVELPDWFPEASKETKEKLRTRLSFMLDHLKRMVGKKAETPESAQ